jgi:Tfp pilus assembly protein PilX
MSTPVAHLRRARSDESGFALPVALAVLVVTLLLAAAAVAVATSTDVFTNHDTRSQAAIAAADAGARTAVYRLNSFAPDDTHCPDPSNDAVGTNGAPTSTLCAPQTESLGNGESFTYYMSGGMQSSSPCTGYWMTSTLGNLHQRCVTSIGSANGVQARVQERIAAYTSYALFPTAIFGTKSVTISNNVVMQTNTPNTPALLGTNGVLNAAPTGGGTTVIDGYQLPPGATLNLGQNVTNNGPTTPYPTPYPTPTAINPGSTAINTSSPFDTSTTFQGGTCLNPGRSGFEQTNCDYRLSCPDLISCDPHTGSISFDPVGRTLYLSNNASLVLGGGYYNFCSLYLSNNSSITVAPGVQALIYIDSPTDPSSGTKGSSTNPPCSNSSSAHGVAAGTFTMSQNSTMNAGGSALNAEVFVYGDPADDPPTNAVNLQNNGSSSFALVAPFSNVTVAPSNNSVFVGAIVGYTVTLGNKSHFTYEADTGPLQNPALGLYYRAYWEQCATKPTSATDPTSGC